MATLLAQYARYGITDVRAAQHRATAAAAARSVRASSIARSVCIACTRTRTHLRLLVLHFFTPLTILSQSRGHTNFSGHIRLKSKNCQALGRVSSRQACGQPSNDSNRAVSMPCSVSAAARESARHWRLGSRV